jgi:hypothetical protein
MNAMLMLLLALHVWWFYLMLRILMGLIGGQDVGHLLMLFMSIADATDLIVFTHGTRALLRLMTSDARNTKVPPTVMANLPLKRSNTLPGKPNCSYFSTT